MLCPLCENIENASLVVAGMTYYHCCNCGLTFLDENYRLQAEEEKKRYSYHQNDISNEGYVNFLNKIIQPAMQYITKQMKGLDFGCGPNPVLAQLLQNKGIECNYYDPFFFPDTIFSNYDFVFATECFEHFFSPKIEIERLRNMLNPQGLLCIMTELAQSNIDFASWYYKNDPTHVTFFSEKTINFICKTYNFSTLYNDHKRTIILQLCH